MTEIKNIPPFFYIVNVEAAIFHEDRWLMIKRSEQEDYAGGTISFVGGKVADMEYSEDVLEKTLKREVFEEVGVEIEDKMVYINSTLFIADNQPVVDIIFLCKYKSGKAHCKSPSEVAVVYWMTTEEVVNHPNTPPWLVKNIEIADKVRNKFWQNKN